MNARRRTTEGDLRAMAAHERKLARRQGNTYPLGEFEVRAFSNAIQAAKLLRAHGTRQPHGIGPNRPLTSAQRRDVDLIERAATRLFDLDAKARR